MAQEKIKRQFLSAKKTNARGFGSARFNLPSRRNPPERFEDLTAPPRAKNRALHSAPAAKNPARRLRQPVGNADISG